MNGDQEEMVLHAVKGYVKSLEYLADPGASGQGEEVTDGIDKESYQKTKWMRMLYGKIVSKRDKIPALQALTPEQIMLRMIEMSKVRFSLAEHLKKLFKKIIFCISVKDRVITKNNFFMLFTCKLACQFHI